MDNQRIGELTPEALEALKSKNQGRIYLIELEDDGVTHCLYLRRPDFDTLRAISKVASSDAIESARILLVNCKVAGSDAVLNDGVLMMAAATASGELLTSVKARLKNV